MNIQVCSINIQVCSVNIQVCFVKIQFCSVNIQVCSVNIQVCSVNIQVCSVNIQAHTFSLGLYHHPFSAIRYYLYDKMAGDKGQKEERTRDPQYVTPTLRGWQEQHIFTALIVRPSVRLFTSPAPVFIKY